MKRFKLGDKVRLVAVELIDSFEDASMEFQNYFEKHHHSDLMVCAIKDGDAKEMYFVQTLSGNDVSPEGFYGNELIRIETEWDV